MPTKGVSAGSKCQIALEGAEKMLRCREGAEVTRRCRGAERVLRYL